MSTLLCIKWNGGTEPSAAWLGRHLSSHATRAHSSHPLHSSLSRDKTASNPSGRRGQVLVNYQSSAHPFSRPHTKLPIHPFFICLFTMHPTTYPIIIHLTMYPSVCPSIRPPTIHLHCGVHSVEPNTQLGYMAGMKRREWNICLPDFFFPICSLYRRKG